MTDDGDEQAALTLGELVDEAVRQLADAGVDDSEISARRIGEAAAGVEPAEYPIRRAGGLTRRMVAHADAMLARRVAGEPLQYVVGSWSFRYLDLAVDARALIPRPETEVVAGVGVQELLGLGRECVAVDLGTGSGAIALSLAMEVPRALVHATDRSGAALDLARANLAGLGRAGSRVTLTEGDWFDALDPDLRGNVDLVISNPPYVATGDPLPPVVADWEPSEALFAGEHGLDDLEHLLQEARFWLRPGGLLVLECAPHQAPVLAVDAARRGYVDIAVADDLSGRPRALVARRPDGEPDAGRLAAMARRLHDGELVVAPTDTVPGLLACYLDEAAVRRVYDVKRRPLTQPLPVLVADLDQAEQLVELSPWARELAAAHWPGALTVVARRRGGPDPVHGEDTLGVRVPDLGWLRALIAEVGPVTGSSANLHGEPTPDDAAEAARRLGVEDWVDGGGGGGTPSTVVDVTGTGPVVLRQGAIELS